MMFHGVVSVCKVFLKTLGKNRSLEGVCNNDYIIFVLAEAICFCHLVDKLYGN